MVDLVTSLSLWTILTKGLRPWKLVEAKLKAVAWTNCLSLPITSAPIAQLTRLTGRTLSKFWPTTVTDYSKLSKSKKSPPVFFLKSVRPNETHGSISTTSSWTIRTTKIAETKKTASKNNSNDNPSNKYDSNKNHSNKNHSNKSHSNETQQQSTQQQNTQ